MSWQKRLVVRLTILLSIVRAPLSLVASRISLELLIRQVLIRQGRAVRKALDAVNCESNWARHRLLATRPHDLKSPPSKSNFSNFLAVGRIVGRVTVGRPIGVGLIATFLAIAAVPSEAQTVTPSPNSSISSIAKVRLRVGDTKSIISRFDPLLSGAILQPSSLPTRLAIEAVVNGQAGSVRFDLSGPLEGSSGSFSAIENFSPYSAFGDSDGTFFGRNFNAGSYSLRVRIFSSASGGGTILDDRVINFEVVSTGTTPTPISSLTPSPTATISPSPTNTPSSTATPTPAPTITLSPTSTIVPTSTVPPTTTPVPTASPTGTSSPTVTPTPAASVSATPGASVINKVRLRVGDSMSIISAFDPLLPGTLVRPNTPPARLAIEALTNIQPGSVRFQLTGPLQGTTGSFTAIDNVAPFSAFGDTDGIFAGRNFSNGDYSLRVSAFSGSDAGGALLEEKTIDFVVLDKTQVFPTPIPTGTPGAVTLNKIRLRVGDSRSVISSFDPLLSGTLVRPATPPAFLAVEAMANGIPGSVRFVLTGPLQGSTGVLITTDNLSPFSAFGDSGGVFFGANFNDGAYSLKVQLFSGVAGGGSLLDERVVDFVVLSRLSPDPTATPSPTPTVLVTATATAIPTATPTPQPTATPVPSASPTPGATATVTPIPTATPVINADAELMIRSLNVVEDAGRTADPCNPNIGPGLGAWSFGKLMTDMAGDGDPAVFVEDWLSTFTVNQTINGDLALARPNVDPLILGSWPRLPNGKLDLAHSPFRLLAIVYRPDVSEGRFVFGALGPNCEALPFTVILEYSLPSSPACVWAQRFHSLGSVYGDPTFNSQLQQITDLFATKDRSPSRSNGSAINQVRTGESALGIDGVWEIREFKLQTASPVLRTAKLSPNEVANTPKESLNGSTTLGDIMNGQATLGAANSAQSLRGAKARLNVLWQGVGVDPDKRHQFAANTCNGCHSGETGTGATHIAPRSVGEMAELSGFLTGIAGVVDPVDSSITRDFNDLQKRSDRVRTLLSSTCP